MPAKAEIQPLLFSWIPARASVSAAWPE